MNSTLSGYRVDIRQRDNGYTIEVDGSAVSKVFEKLEDVLEYVKNFFNVGEKTRKKE